MGADRIHVALARRLRTGRPGRVLGLWPWSPLPFAAAYLLIVATKFSAIVHSTYANADYASAPVIAQLFGGSPAHREVFLGQVGWYSTLMFELATRWLPLHRDIWEAAPYAMLLASVAAISWAAWKVGGRWAATITGALLLCAGPQTLGLLFALDDHSSTWFSIALLAALLILLESRPALARWQTALVVAVVGLIVGANAASDLLLDAAGLVPFALAAVGAWWLSPGRASARALGWALGTLAVAVVGDLATRWLMRHEAVVTPPGLVHTQLAAATALSPNFELWWQSLMLLGNGNFFGQLLGFTSSLELACALLVLAVVALIPRTAWRAIAAALPAPGARGDGMAPLPAAWCIFWATSALLLSASFVFSSNPVDLESSRYLVGVIYAVAAIAPLLARRSTGRRALITAATVLFAFTGAVTVAQTQYGSASTYALYDQVADIATSEHLKIGYADYWDAAPLTWSTRFRLKVYPVQDCVPNSGPTLCWSYLHMISSWYVPRPRTRTFLVSDSAQPSPASAQANLGKPVAEYQIGALTMYVYSYDIASKMIP